MFYFKGREKYICLITIFSFLLLGLFIQILCGIDFSFLDPNNNQINNPTIKGLKTNSPEWIFSTNETTRMNHLAISSDGNYIIVGSYNINKVYFFHRSSSIPLWTYELNGYSLNVAISLNGDYIVVSTSGNNVYLFNRTSPNPLWSSNYGSDPVGCIAISSDGNYIVVGVEERVYLYHKNSSTPLWSRYTGDYFFTGASMSSDGTYIAIGGYDNLYFFNKNSSTPIWSYGGVI